MDKKVIIIFVVGQVFIDPQCDFQLKQSSLFFESLKLLTSSIRLATFFIYWFLLQLINYCWNSSQCCHSLSIFDSTFISRRTQINKYFLWCLLETTCWPKTTFLFSKWFSKIRSQLSQRVTLSSILRNSNSNMSCKKDTIFPYNSVVSDLYHIVYFSACTNLIIAG